jgi:hypothetical protein
MKDVISIACQGIVAVIIVGGAFDKLKNYYWPKDKMLVLCSYEIKNMAAKINVTLLSECEVER